MHLHAHAKVIDTCILFLSKFLLLQYFRLHLYTLHADRALICLRMFSAVSTYRKRVKVIIHVLIQRGGQGDSGPHPLKNTGLLSNIGLNHLKNDKAT